MTYAGLQMFMEKLNQLINCNHIPSINNPAIIRERTQFQLLHEDLASMIQTLFIDQHQDLHDLEQVNDLKKRFIDSAEEVQHIVDLFLSRVHIRNTRQFPTYGEFKRSFKSVVYLFLSCVHINGHFRTSGDLKRSLNLDDVRRSLKSVEVEFMSMCIGSLKMDSSPRPRRMLNQSVAGQRSISKNSLGSKKLSGEIVGLDPEVELIRDKLVGDQKKVDVVSVVGMGGIGKTTLATKVFNDRYVHYHFHVLVWVTVSQTYDKRGVLTQILESIGGQLDLEKANDSRLRELVHKKLTGKRYLIVIDDIWHIETWDNLKVFFPHDNTGSRILLTSRLIEVAKHANPNGLIRHLGYLNQERSWELLQQKVFYGNNCPEWSIKLGMQIVENCQGLPLAVVVVAGVLAKDARSKKLWKEIAERTGSYIVGDQNGCMEALGLSYIHLPLHLRECFLYLGGFPEDYMFKVQKLIWLWVAEGFIQEDENGSLEEIAEGYLMDLIDRNLVLVDKKGPDGGVKTCKVHDLVRELCLRKAKEKQFLLQTQRPISNVIIPPYKSVRMFMNKDVSILDIPYPSTQNIRSLLCFSDLRFVIDDIAKCFRSFVLLRVLDLHNSKLNDFPKGMDLLVHLRYLAICKSSAGFPSSICNLWGLQTLIYTTNGHSVALPSNIANLENLRHLWSFSFHNNKMKNFFFLPFIEKPMNLQTISDMELGDWGDNFQKCFPYINELTCRTRSEKEYDFQSLTYLEKLNFIGHGNKLIRFPTTLRSLTLEWCHLPWSEMSIIWPLPNLQVLKLKNYSFWGSCWNTDGHVFPQLKLLRLDRLDIKQWEAYSTSFPCLKQLEVFSCYDLEEVPLEIGDIPTLELVTVGKYCRGSLGESVRRIEDEQHDSGNYDLKIDIQEK